MRRVLLVGVKFLAEPIAGMAARQGQVSLQEAADLDQLPAAEPDVIIVPQDVLGDEPDAVRRLLRRWPRLAATLIVLELPWTMRVLERPTRATSRWRRRPLGELDRELASRLVELEQLRDLGYYDLVEADGREFHVQTEVFRAGSGDLVVRTTVLDGGTVSLSKSEPYPLEACVDVAHGRALVERQHRGVVAQLAA